MASKRPSPAQIRERRARIAAVVLGVAFLGIAVIQGPKLLKSIQGGSSASEPPTSTAASTTPGTPGSTTTTAALGVLAAAAGPGQLHGFSLFAPGVPFKPIPQPALSGLSTTTSAGASSAVRAASSNAADTHGPPRRPPPPRPPPPAGAGHDRGDRDDAGPTVTFTVPNGVPAAVVTVNGKTQLFGVPAPSSRQEAPLFRARRDRRRWGSRSAWSAAHIVDGQQYLVIAKGNKVDLDQPVRRVEAS